MRNPVRALAAASLIVGPTVLAFFSGGFFDRPRLVAAIAAWVILAVAVLVVDDPLPRGGPARAAVAGLALLTLWTGLSYEWAPLGERAQGDVQRVVGYLGLFLAGVLLLRGTGVRRWVEPGLAAGAFAATAYGLSPRLLPDLVDLNRSNSADGRLEQPLTYWNAMGCLSSIGLVLCARIAADARRPRAVRAAAGFCGPALGLGTYLSFSRGALVALAAGVALLIALAPATRAQLRAVALLAGASAIACVVASRLPRVESLAPSQGADAGDALVMLVVLLIVSSAAAVAAALSSPPDAAPRAAGGMRRRATALALVAVVLGSVAGAALLEKNPAARPGGNATSATRFGSADTTRYAFWEVALEGFADDPLKGSGSGGFAVEWRRQPDRTERAVDAHSLYIETLSELGLVGAGFLALFLGGILSACIQLGRRDPAAVAGPAAAFLVWAVHAGLDWDWELPALTGVALVLAGAIVSWNEPGSTPPRDREPTRGHPFRA